MKNSNWGGYRPGSGQKPKWKSGETKPLRIPVALHEQVLAFTQLLDAGEQPDELLSCDLPSHLGNVTESKPEKTTKGTLDIVTLSSSRESSSDFDNVTQGNETVTVSSQDRTPLSHESVTLSSDLKNRIADWNSKASKSSNPKWHDRFFCVKTIFRFPLSSSNLVLGHQRSSKVVTQVRVKLRN